MLPMDDDDGKELCHKLLSKCNEEIPSNFKERCSKQIAQTEEPTGVSCYSFNSGSLKFGTKHSISQRR